MLRVQLVLIRKDDLPFDKSLLVDTNTFKTKVEKGGKSVIKIHKIIYIIIE